MFPTRILVATDAPDEAYPAVEGAVELANGTTSELQVVFVVSTAPELPYPKLIAKERNGAYLEQKRLGELGLLQHQARRVEEMGEGWPSSIIGRETRSERWSSSAGRSVPA
jgi:nucleotide-binding universal stress UspA family protein